MRRHACRLFLLALLPIAACAPTRPPVITSAEPAQPPLSDADRAFLAEAASAETAELQAERTALASTHNRAVQAYAQDTASQVSEELTHLQALAAARQVSLPELPEATMPDPAPMQAIATMPAREARRPTTAHAKGAKNSIRKNASLETGPSRQAWPGQPRFADKNFLMSRIAAQEATLALFRQEEAGGSDPELRKCAALYAQRTEQHLRLAQEVARRL